MQPATQPLGSLHAAVDHDSLNRLFSSVGFAVDPSVDDFTRNVVVAVTVPAGGCWTEVTGVERNDRVVQVLFDDVTPEGVEPCTTTDTPSTFVVAIDRQGLAPSFTLMLPANDTLRVRRAAACRRGTGAGKELCAVRTGRDGRSPGHPDGVGLLVDGGELQ